jgi:uncharacterized protein YjbI with pentapeptide repeats
VANEEQLNILRQGVDFWNGWREEKNPLVTDLSGADLAQKNLFRANFFQTNLFRTNLHKALLRGADLREADLREANLGEADLCWARLEEANLSSAVLSQAELSNARLSGACLNEAHLNEAFLDACNLEGASLRGAILREVDLTCANLRNADLSWSYLHNAKIGCADLTRANLYRADVGGANLERTTLAGAQLKCAQLTDTNLSKADLTGAKVYGVSVWNVKLDDTVQKDIVITDYDELVITVDNLAVAQFIYLLLNNEEIRRVIETITSKMVLILGRFTENRKYILDALRERLRHLNYTSVMFDFLKPTNRDFTETVTALAHLSRFIIVDLTESKSVPQELQAVVPNLAVPVIPIIQNHQKSWGMWQDFYKFNWVLNEHRYDSLEGLLKDAEEKLLPQALEKIDEIQRLRSR